MESETDEILEWLKNTRARKLRLTDEYESHLYVMKAIANNRSITTLDLKECEVRMFMLLLNRSQFDIIFAPTSQLICLRGCCMISFQSFQWICARLSPATNSFVTLFFFPNLSVDKCRDALHRRDVIIDSHSLFTLSSSQCERHTRRQSSSHLFLRLTREFWFL
jgi:hypothetical protein